MMPKTIAFILFALILLLILRSLIQRDKDDTSKINLEDLLVAEDGRVSKVAVAFWGAFIATTWAFVYLTLRDKLTDMVFTAYGAMWVIPLTAKFIFNAPVMPSAPGATVTTELSSSKTTVVQPPAEEK